MIVEDDFAIDLYHSGDTEANRMTSPKTQPLAKEQSKTCAVGTKEAAVVLRSLLGMAPDEPIPEITVALRRSMPLATDSLDRIGWLAWCLVGLVLFADGLPDLRRIRLESKRVAVVLGMFRAAGNISRAARALGVSRKVLRDNLRAAGLYPWGERVEALGLDRDRGIEEIDDRGDEGERDGV